MSSGGPRLAPEDLAARLARRDLSLWPLGAAAADHLGFVDAARHSERDARELRRFADGVDEEIVVVLGVDATPTAARGIDALARQEGHSERHLVVLDSLDPAAVEALPLTEAFVVLVCAHEDAEPDASALLTAAFARGLAPRRLAVVAPPDTRLGLEAAERGARRVIAQPPALGDRFGALGPAVTVPAALAGVDIAEFAGRVIDVDAPAAVARGLALAEVIGPGQPVWRVALPGATAALGPWLETVVAGALGGDARGGCALVSDGNAATSGSGDLAVPPDVGALGAWFHGVLLSLAAAGWALGLDPFAHAGVTGRAETDARLADPLDVPPQSRAPEELFAALAEEVGPDELVTVALDVPERAALDGRLRAALGAIGPAPVLDAAGARVRHGWGALRSAGPPGLAVTIVARRPPALAPGPLGALAARAAAASAGEHDALLAAGRRVCRIGVDSLDELL